MSERTVASAVMMSQEKPLIKIGYYVLGETLGVGTFGKVKSTFAHLISKLVKSFGNRLF